ncbi:MAG: hypothetical protein R3A48_22920 [Polyangiales bacterium]
MRAHLIVALLAASCATEPSPHAAPDVVSADAPPVDVTATDAATSPPDVVDVPAPQDVTLDAGPPPATRLGVLFIGNSYTFYNELPTLVASLGASGEGTAERPRLTVDSVTEGGATLQRHWDQMRQERARAGGWSAVVLQGQSVEPIAAFQGFDAYARRFAEVIRGAGARPVYFATWARREGDAVYGQAWSGGSFAAMSQRLDNAYRLVAMNTDGEVAPVGARWAAAVRQRPELNLYDADGSHPSLAGSYLAACVIYRAVTGRAVAAEAPVPSGLPPGDALFLRSIAASP